MEHRLPGETQFSFCGDGSAGLWIPVEARPRMKEALQTLVQLYQRTEKPAVAERWQGELAAFEKTEGKEARSNESAPTEAK